MEYNSIFYSHSTVADFTKRASGAMLCEWRSLEARVTAEKHVLPVVSWNSRTTIILELTFEE